MKLRIVTTITTLIDADTLEPEHQVEVDAEDAAALPPRAIYAAVVGACKSTIKSVEVKSQEAPERPSCGSCGHSAHEYRRCRSVGLCRCGL